VAGVIDAHHHLWDPAARPLPWLEADQAWASAAELAPLRRAFTLRELEPLAAEAGVTATVAVQAMGETRETAELLAVSGGLVQGVVGWVDLTAPDCADQLAALRSLPGGSALCGIRHPLLAEPDADWMDRDAVRRGLRALGGLCFDIAAMATQLPRVVTAVRALPDVHFVLDHLGIPPIGSEDDGQWATSIRQLGALDNVTCKLSGALVEPSGLALLRPRFDVALEAFGPDRLMFGSDWPVSTLTAPYTEISGMYVDLIADLSPAERTAILDGTARRAYSLP
jgi:L-fuconolactonase